MSGGHFDSKQHAIENIIEELREVISDNNIKDDYGYSNDYSDKTIAEFKKGLEILKQAKVYTQRIDWLLSGDDGEDSFNERLKEDLNN